MCNARYPAGRPSNCAALTARHLHKEYRPMGQHRPLDPTVARIVEALADLMVDRDITRLRAATPTPAAQRAATTIDR
jgi:hypothetical protein